MSFTDAVGSDHDVLGLDVAVQDALAVGVAEGAADLHHDHGPDLGELGRVVGDALLEGLALDELGDDVALAADLARVVEDLEDVLVAQLGHGVGLALEAVAGLVVIGEVAVQDLDRDVALERPIRPR
jgi:hypothetical protein